MTSELCVILHVPKCAGRTIERHLRDNLSAGGLWIPQRRTGWLPLEMYDRKYDPKPPGPLDAISAVSGHFIGRSIEQLFPHRRIVRSVILRNPVEWVLSYYNYRMMRYVSHGQSPYSFETHFNSLPADPVAHFLLERWLELPWITIARLSTSKKIAILDDALGKLDWVADISEASDVAAWHSRKLGIPEVAKRVNTSQEWQQKTGWKPLSLHELQPDAVDALNRRLSIDKYLWQRWALKRNIEYYGNPAGFLRNEITRSAYQIYRRLLRDHG